MVLLMKIFIGVICYNVILLLFVFFTLSSSNDQIKMSNLKDLSGYSLNDGLDHLANFNVDIMYVESNEEEHIILYSSPQANSLVYDNQLIVLYVSSGSVNVEYKPIKNRMYKEYISYIDMLRNEYNIEVVIDYINSKYLPDGLIYEFKTLDEKINYNDTVYITIVKNEKYVLINVQTKRTNLSHISVQEDGAHFDYAITSIFLCL